MLVLFLTLLSGCALYDPTCSRVDIDYQGCCCELVDLVSSKYGGGSCAALDECYNAGFYEPIVYQTPDYARPDIDWIRCPNGIDGQYEATCDGGGLGDEQCAEELTGIWQAVFTSDVVSDATDDGVTCSTEVATGGYFNLYLGFAGTDDSGRAVGVFSGEGEIYNSLGATAQYASLLDPDSGNGIRYASATLYSDGWASIEIYTGPPSADGTCDPDLLSVVWAYVDPYNPGVLYADFSRDPAFDAYPDVLECHPLGFHGIEFNLLDATDPAVMAVQDMVDAAWDAASAECNAGIVTPCAESSTTSGDEDGAAGQPPPSTPDEFVARIPPVDYGWFPIGGNYNAAFADAVTTTWYGIQFLGTDQWRSAAHGAAESMFTTSPNGKYVLVPAIAEMVGPSVSQIDWDLVHNRAHWLVEALTTDPIHRGAINILVERYRLSDRGTNARAELEWGVFQTFQAMPQPGAPPIGMPPAPPPNPPVQ